MTNYIVLYNVNNNLLKVNLIYPKDPQVNSL